MLKRAYDKSDINTLAPKIKINFSRDKNLKKKISSRKVVMINPRNSKMAAYKNKAAKVKDTFFIFPFEYQFTLGSCDLRLQDW